MNFTQRASSLYLTEEIPDNWESMEYHEQDCFLEEHLTEQTEKILVSEVWQLIIDTEELMQEAYLQGRNGDE